MTDRETSGAATPPDILAAMERGYQGEVYGEAMYSAMASAETDPVRRWKWMVLVQLELETKAAMHGLLRRRGGNTGESETERQQGLAEAERLTPMQWQVMLRDFMSDLPGLVDEYADLERRAAFTGKDAEALRLLTTHEVVTLRFCEAELAGQAGSSIEPVLALLQRPPLRP